MTWFWILSGLLAAAALAWLIRPRGAGRVSRSSANLSIYRDQLRELGADLAAGTLAQSDYERARRELESRLLADVAGAENAPAPRSRRGLAAALALAVPAAAVGLYFLVGNPGAIDSRQADDHALSAQQLESMVARLADRLRENPDDVAGWALLGRSYGVLGRFPEAADAYAKAAARAPRDAQLLADFADALGMARGQRLAGEPEKLIARALEIDPQNLKALALAGTAAFDRKDYVAAAAYWQRMVPLVPPGSEDARVVQANVDEARSLAGRKDAKPHRGIRGTVRISSSLKEKAAPDDTVFIFARAADGPPMPLAVLRKRVRDLPAAFALDDSLAMAPGMALSGFPRVVVAARISKSASAAPQPGDLQGASAAVANDAEGVNVVIDSIVR